MKKIRGWIDDKSFPVLFNKLTQLTADLEAARSEFEIKITNDAFTNGRMHCVQVDFTFPYVTDAIIDAWCKLWFDAWDYED